MALGRRGRWRHGAAPRRVSVPGALASALVLAVGGTAWTAAWTGAQPAWRATAQCGRGLQRRATGPAGAAAPSEVVDAEVLEGEGGAGAGDDAGPPPPLSTAAELRAALLARVNGLDRGRLASQEDVDEVARLARELERAAEEADRWRLRFPEDLDKLEGRWRLLYTSAFAGGLGRGGSLGGLRPGPPMESPVAEVGDIFQRYRTNASCADTTVQLRPPRWLRDTGVLEQLPFVGSNPDTVITLTQKFDVASNDTLRFAFSEGQVESGALEQLRPLQFPMTLLGIPPDVSRDSPVTDTLATTYCDGELRIGIGGRFGELRLFLRV